MLDDEHMPGVDVLDALPVFPLPNAVLLPGMVLPLNVFEPRYLDLVDHALVSGRTVGIPLLKPGFEDDYDGRPAIEPVFGVGHLLSHQQLPDGRRFIRVEGLRRVRMRRELEPRHSFREVEVELLPEACPEDEHQFDVLKAQLERIGVTLRPDDRQLVDSVLSIPDPRVLVYAVAAIVPTLGLLPEPLEGRSPLLDLQQRCLDIDNPDTRVGELLDMTVALSRALDESGRSPRTLLN